MTLYGLRLLVALLTFLFGVASTRLFTSSSPKECGRRMVVSQSADITTVAVEVPDPTMEALSNRHSCKGTMPKHVVQGGTLDFKAVSKPPAIYPPAARALGITDTIVVRVLVDEDGKVLTAEATGGHALLREAAEEAARAARFRPTLLAGQPVRVSGDITYNFVLD